MSKKTQGIHRHELFLFRFIHFQYLLFGKVIQLVRDLRQKCTTFCKKTVTILKLLIYFLMCTDLITINNIMKSIYMYLFFCSLSDLDTFTKFQNEQLGYF